MVRCQRQKGGEQQYIEDIVHEMLFCAQYVTQIKPFADRECAALFPAEGTDGWQVSADYYYVANPHTLVACKALGRSCAAPAVLSATWQCPARCVGAQDEYATTFSLCAVSEKYALRDGLDFYKSGGSHPVCSRGYDLKSYDQPTDLRCQSTLKECGQVR